MSCGVYMEFKITSGTPEQLETQCLVVGIGEGGDLGSAAQALDDASNGYLSSVLEAGDISGKKAQTLLLQAIPGIKAKRTLLVGLGKAEERNDNNFIKVISAALSVIKSIQCSGATFSLDQNASTDRDCYWQTRKLVETISADKGLQKQWKIKLGWKR